MADALSYLFHVKLDWVDVGLWTECTGLAAKYDVEEYAEGGQNMFVHKFPGRVKFENIKLKRPVNKDSEKLAKYFASVLVGSVARSTASVSVYDANLEEVATWNFIDVVPVSWKGPDFNVENEKVAIEEFEFAHHGFGFV